MSPGYNTGMPGYGQGMSPGYNTGMPGYGQGMSPGYNTGMPGSGQGMSPGYNTGMPGYSQVMGPRNNAGMSGYGQGMSPGYNWGMPAGGSGMYAPNGMGQAGSGQGMMPGNSVWMPGYGWVMQGSTMYPSYPTTMMPAQGCPCYNSQGWMVSTQGCLCMQSPPYYPTTPNMTPRPPQREPRPCPPQMASRPHPKVCRLMNRDNGGRFNQTCPADSQCMFFDQDMCPNVTVYLCTHMDCVALPREQRKRCILRKAEEIVMQHSNTTMDRDGRSTRDRGTGANMQRPGDRDLIQGLMPRDVPQIVMDHLKCIEDMIVMAHTTGTSMDGDRTRDDRYNPGRG